MKILPHGRSRNQLVILGSVIWFVCSMLAIGVMFSNSLFVNDPVILFSNEFKPRQSPAYEFVNEVKSVSRRNLQSNDLLADELWFVEIGTYASIDYADNLLKSIQRYGYPESEVIVRFDAHVVRLGPYSQKNRAIAAANDLKGRYKVWPKLVNIK